ncbi:NAC domain [Macleaya cordata]|uniref:NAC domain n=1 Tax=Macleaya cordata TaxID=56857 RepID=A0A200R5F8_MACCD|nr:NAC domain [Macleaya cordata]
MGGESASSLAPGFRFHPTDEELVSYYLKRKVCGKPFRFDAISEIDIYKSEPWDLPGQSRLKSRDLEWYFFSALDKKYGNGWRTNRATDQGYWKTTGKDRAIHRGNRTVGMKKTLVYHIGRAPRGERTNWVMHEYRLVDDELVKQGIVQDAFVLCRVFQKSGTGPKNGEQYGAPFIEEEWDVEDISIPEREIVGNGGSSDGGDEESSHPQNNNEQNLALAIPPVNVVLPADPDSGNGWNLLEDPMSFLGEGQKLFIGSGENDVLPELPHEQEFFDFPEEFEMDQTLVKSEYFELNDLSNPPDARNDADEPVAGELSYFAAPSDPPVVNGSYIEINDLVNPVESDPAGFEMLDEYLTYFDAAEDYFNYEDLDTSNISAGDDPVMNKSAVTEEVNRGYEQAYLASPEPSKTNGGEVASSSKQQPEMGKVAPDVKYDEGWDSTLAKQVSRMLGSISAPPAFAAEFPAKEAIVGQNSTTQSSSSIHVTAGMIHISSMTVSGDGKEWLLRKSGGVDFLLPYGLTSNDAMTVEHLMSSKAGSMMARSTFYLIFLWVLILSVSCKVGSYIYTR